MTASAPVGDPFEALGDPNRRAIVELLGSGGRSVGPRRVGALSCYRAPELLEVAHTRTLEVGASKTAS